MAVIDLMNYMVNKIGNIYGWNTLNLRTVDLNLLVMFEALVSTRHVTRAAEKIGLSQPAMSNGLRRLRVVFGDELLVRTPNGMQPTPRALELEEPVKSILRQIGRILEPDEHFDPYRTSREFRIRLSDVLAVLVLPPFLQKVSFLDTNIKVDTVHASPSQTVDALERDELDLAVSFGLLHGTTILSEPLFLDKMICVVREGHPFSGKAPDIDAFLKAKHVRVSMSPTDTRFVDDVILAAGQRRETVLNLQHWLVLPPVLRASDLVAVMPERLFGAIDNAGLHKCALPIEQNTFEWTVYWHRRHDRNPAIRWLRENIFIAANSEQIK